LGWHDQTDLFSRSLKGLWYDNRFWRKWTKIDIFTFILCIGIPQQIGGSQVRNMVQCPVALSFAGVFSPGGLQAGLCSAFLVLQVLSEF